MRDGRDVPQRSRWTWLIMPLTLLGATRASAQECQADSECGAGYRCAVSPGYDCSSCVTPGGDAGMRDAGTLPLPTPGPTPPTADAGSAVVAVDAGWDGSWGSDASLEWDSGWDANWCIPTCVPVDYHYCEPAPCTSDSDCPASMACYAQSYTTCDPEVACDPSVGCDKDAGYTCTEHTRSTCTERYNIPCRTDPECGPGFECNREPQTTCSGGGGVTPGADGGWIFVDASMTCTTEVPDTGWCSLVTLPCAADTECPTGLTCQAQYEYPPCTWPGQDAGTMPSKDLDGGYFCPPPVLTHVCRPESWGGGFVGGPGGGFMGGPGGGYPEYDAGSGTDASAPPTSGGGSPGGGGGVVGGGLGGGGGTGDAGTSSGPTPGEDDEDEGDDEGDDHGHPSHGLLRGILKQLFGKGGGCSVAGEAQGNLGWLSLLGLFLMRRRRGA
jgi:hypothetical protein